jgi:predicted AlkP superfamily phosphohydrolase/phosphomutase/Flp pilus assembly protein TadD
MSSRALRQAAGAGVLLLSLSCRRGESAGSATPSASAAPTAAAPSSAAIENSDVAQRTKREAGKRKPVIWLGLDGLDWELLDRLSAAGRMPNWKRLTDEGYTAKLTSFMPILSPIVWTSIATGAPPDVHRVLDFQEADPSTGQKVPISGRSRAVPALWNMASAAGIKVGVVGWWATHPAEEVDGFFITDHASPILFENLSRAGVAYPTSLAQGVVQVVARDGRVEDEDLVPYVDMSRSEMAAARRDGGGLTNPYVALASIVGATRVQQRIARDLYDRNLPDLMMLYFEGTDGIGHVFASFVPPRMSCVSEAEFAKYHKAVDEYYAMMDRLIGQWMRRAEEDGATLVVNSDHGFKWGADRPCERSSINPATAAYWHRIDGVFAAWGPRVRGGQPRGSASVFDVAPTVASLLGLPRERRWKGRAIQAAFTDLPEPRAADLFGTVAVRRVAAEAPSAKDADEYAARLRALGYLSGGEPSKVATEGGDRPGLTEGGWNNLGIFLRDTRKDYPAAEEAFRKSLALRPNYASPTFNLAVLYREKGDDAKAIDYLFKSFEAGHADPEGTTLRWVDDYEKAGKAARAREVLDRAVRTYPQNETYARELGLQRFKEKDCPGARETVARFETATQDPETLNALALFDTCLGRKDEAVALFQRSLAIKPGQRGVIESLNLLQRVPPPGS